MSRFNRGTIASATGASPMRSAATPDSATHEGGVAFSREPRTEVFLLATGGYIAEDAYYESGDQRVERFVNLVRSLAVSDPEWLWEFLTWLRAEGNIRTAPIVGAVEAVRARVAHERLVAQAAPHGDGGLPVNPPGVVGGSGDRPRGWNRTLIDQVCQRADEPGEMMAYHLARYGRALPKPIKRGLADAVGRLCDEYSSFKYDSERAQVRFGDVIELCHPHPGLTVQMAVDTECPTPTKRRYATERGAPTRIHRGEVPLRAYRCVCGWVHTTSRPIELAYEMSPRRKPELVLNQARSDLYRWLLDRRHGRAPVSPETASETLPLVRARLALQSVPVNERRGLVTQSGPAGGGAELLRSAGYTWEAVSGWIQGPMDAKVWEALIPTMGLMALTRNLANFDDAGIGTEAFSQVAGKLANRSAVQGSRVLPYRFYQACRNASPRWTPALEAALLYSTANIPALPGRTLVLIDTSGSMQSTLSGRSAMTYAEAGALFGVALAVKANNAELLGPDGMPGSGGVDGSFGVDLYGFAGGGYGRRTFRHAVPQRAGVLETVAAFAARIGEVGHGTEILASIRETLEPHHQRVVVISDMQTFFERGDTVDNAVPQSVPVYGFNLAGYRSGVLAGSGRMDTNRHDLGGLTDHTFGMIRSLEQGQTGDWPWEAAR